MHDGMAGTRPPMSTGGESPGIITAHACLAPARPIGAGLKPAADMHDEWQSGERHDLSEGSMAQLKPTCDPGGIAAIDSGE